MTRNTIPRHDSQQRGRQERDRLDKMLDMALGLTFPASDPVAITVATSQLSESPGVKPAALPKGCEAYRKTAVFTQDTVPGGLLRAHRTAADVWALIHVLNGRLLYRINEPTICERVIEVGIPGVIEPAISHEVVPLGKTRFYIEFHRRSQRS
jgi:tellurite resistance-related uncharacterized protein